MRYALIASALLVSLSLAISPASSPAADWVDPFGFNDADYSLWGIDSAPYPYDPAKLGEPNNYGCFPLGNGLVFAHLGVDADFNSLRGITGPGYQTRNADGAAVYWQEGNWPDMRTQLVNEAGKPYEQIVKYGYYELPGFNGYEATQSIEALRGAAMVRTIWRTHAIDLFALSYAVPGYPMLVQEFVLYGVPEWEPAIRLMLPDASLDENGDPYITRGENKLVVTGFGFCPEDYQSDTTIDHEASLIRRQTYNDEEGFVTVPLGQWPDHGNEVFKGVIYYRFLREGVEAPKIDRAPEYYRRQTADWWRAWSAKSLSFHAGPADYPLIDDLMAQLPVIIETQRDHYSGGCAPMVSYHGYWVRDSNGPLLTYLANGRFSEVMRMLRYHRAACLNYGHCHMLVPLDLDLSDLPGWQPDNTGVGQAPVLAHSEESRAGALALLQDMTPGGSETGPYNATAGELSNIGTAPEDWEGVGVEHAEVPSLIVLQHFWLWQALHSSGLAEEADAFIAEAWPFIAHNLYAMEYDPAYGVKFHGDETYTHGSLYSTYDRPESGQIGYPNGYIPTDFFSFDNTLLHWSAALAAAEMADDQHVAKKALQLAHGLERCLRSYHYERSWHGKGLAPAISPLTHQLWPYPFSNLSLAGNSLAVNYGNMSIKYRVCMERFVVCGRLARQYKYMKQALHEPESWQAAGEPLISWWTTPWCGFGTGHALGTWLNAARYNADKQSCSEIEAQMLATASPEGAWCEVLDPQGQPVNIYGRVNRIRPWESGINYVMLAAWLNEQDQLVLGEDGEARQRVLSQITDGFQRDKQYYDEVERWQDSPRYDPSWFGYYTAEEQGWTWTTPPDETQLLVITRDNHYQDLIKQDRRLAGLTDKQVCAWDAGLPFSVHDLDAALFNGPVGAGLRPALDQSETRPDEETEALRILYLYFDRDVQDGMDRRTFKDEEFWQGEEMTSLLARYEAAGGTIITTDTLDIKLADDEVVALKVLVVLYPRTFTHELSADEIANFHQEVAEWQRWYDEVAGDRLRLEFHFLQIGTRLSPRQCGAQGNDTYWMSYAEVENDLRLRNVPDNYYDSVVCFWAWNRDFALPGGEKAKQAYGGAAQGPASDMEFMGEAGRTSYFGSAVLTSHPDRAGKNAIHEYLHNVDAMFEEVGIERLSHPDHMSLNMETLLSEVPGGFEQWGYSDDEMREMVEAELRNEIHYPWRTQLVYYEQALKRIPHADYGQLLLRFGERTARQPRTKLYERFSLPQDKMPYQVYFEPMAGMEQIEREERDFTDDYLIATQTFWAGATNDDAEHVRWYDEAELLTDDVIEYVVGEDDGPLCVALYPVGGGEALTDPEVWVEWDGNKEYLWCVGDGGYVCDMPTGLGERTEITFYAEAEGWAISPKPVELQLRPAWELSTSWVFDTSGEQPEGSPVTLVLSVDGPAGEYLVAGDITLEPNTIQRLLYADGLLAPADTRFTVLLVPGIEAQISTALNARQRPAFASRFAVSHTAPDGAASSFVHHYPADTNACSLLAGLPEERLPEYVVRARPLTPVLDGMLNEWPETPSLVLAPETGNAFSGEFDDDNDLSLNLHLGYDDEFLYVAGEVKDDQTPGHGAWDADRINLVFDAQLDTTPDTYPEGAVGHTGWAKDDYWVFLNPLLPDGPRTTRLGGERPSGGRNGYYGPVEGAEAAVEPTADGYRFEWAIPFESLPYFAAEPNQLVGFTLFMSDYDESLAELMYLTDWGGADGIEWRFWDCGLLYFAQ